jgi:uncharacterized protein YxjI
MIITKFSKFNEEMNLKKILVGGALAASTLACNNPSTNTQFKSVNTTEIANVKQPTKSIMDAPSTFRMEESLMSFGLDMNITDDNGNDYGIVEERTLSFTKTFELLDSNGNVIAKGQTEAFTLTTVVDVKDESGKLIGTLEQEIFENLFDFGSLYTIKDVNGKVVAKSRKIDFFTTDVSINGSSGNITMTKEFLSFGDQWEIKYNGSIDKRLVAFIPAFISSSQKEKRKQDEE